jgi:large subunit ribosomal protein L19
MQKKIIEFNQAQRNTQKIDFQSGDIIKVYKKIKEGDKERIQIFEGMIIAIKGRQSSSPMMTVRKVSNGVGVEIIIPILSPSIEKIELVKKTTARRAKLYFSRKSGNKNSL